METIRGIYSIVNTENKKVYIGLSIDIYLRWKQHRYALNKSNHPNYFLQNDWNECGEDKFQFNILEICGPDADLDKREIYWGAIFNCNDEDYGYNIVKCGGSVHADEEERRKRRLKRQEELIALNSELHKDIEKCKYERLQRIQKEEEEKKKLIEQKIQNKLYFKEMEEIVFRCLEEERLREEIKNIQR